MNIARPRRDNRLLYRSFCLAYLNEGFYIKSIGIIFALLLGAVSLPPCAAERSTHMLDLNRGVGGQGVPVTLSKRDDSVA
ncbi:MAG: hypothetical protein WBO17_06350 [Sphingorhabdus sp.]